MSQVQDPARRRLRLPWILIALVAAAIVAVTSYRMFRSPDALAGMTQQPSASVDSARQARRLTPDEIRALAARSPGQSAPQTAGGMAAMIEKRKRMTDATQARIQERNAAMAGKFAAEKTDPAWSGARERDLSALQDSGPMQDAGAKAANFEVECRSSMCRIQGDFPNATMANDWLQLYMGSVGNNLPVATAHQVRNPDGSIRIEIYGLGRK